MPPVPTVRPNGPEIRRLRVRRGLTQSALEAMIGRKQGAVSGLERQAWRASLVLINQIANALGVEPEEIIRDDADDETNGKAA